MRSLCTYLQTGDDVEAGLCCVVPFNCVKDRQGGVQASFNGDFYIFAYECERSLRNMIVTAAVPEGSNGRLIMMLCIGSRRLKTL